MIGNAIARFGERWILSIAYAVLIPVSPGYALVPYLPILFGLFALDSVLFSFNAGLTTSIGSRSVRKS